MNHLCSAMNTQHTIAMVQFTQPLQKSGFFLFRSVADYRYCLRYTTILQVLLGIFYTQIYLINDIQLIVIPKADHKRCYHCSYKSMPHFPSVISMEFLRIFILYLLKVTSFSIFFCPQIDENFECVIHVT